MIKLEKLTIGNIYNFDGTVKTLSRKVFEHLLRGTFPLEDVKPEPITDIALATMLGFGRRNSYWVKDIDFLLCFRVKKVDDSSFWLVEISSDHGSYELKMVDNINELQDIINALS